MEFEQPDEPAGYVAVPVERRGGAGHAFAPSRRVTANVVRNVSPVAAGVTPGSQQARTMSFDLPRTV